MTDHTPELPPAVAPGATADDALRALVNARFDGELDTDSAARLDDALALEPARTRAAAWEADLARLGGLLRPDVRDAEGIVERALARLAPDLHPPTDSAPGSPPRDRRAPRWPWLALPLAAAAGFATALLVAPPRERIVVREVRVPVEAGVEPVTPRPIPLGRIALATGALEIRMSDGAGWEVATPGTALLPGTRVRTATGRKATLALTDGSEIRLNAGSELECTGTRRMTLALGELWAHVAFAQGVPFHVATPQANVIVTGTEISLEATVEVTRLVVHSGRARLANLAGREVEVAPQHQALVESGRLGDPARAYQLERGTRWMVELLYLKGRDDPELARKVDALLAGIGSTKMQHLSEEEIRSLGQACTLPLAKHLASSMGHHAAEAPRRRAAARILADIAGIDVLPELILLIMDPDLEVRRQAACGVCRLRGGMTARQLEREYARWADPDEAKREAHKAQLLSDLAPLIGASGLPRGVPGEKK